MRSGLNLGKVLGAIILTILWICCFLFISSTLIIDFGGGITANFKLTVIVLGLLIIFFYHLLYRSSTETTKLSWTVVFTLVWLATILFYPFNVPANASDSVKTTWPGGAIGFFTLVGGLAVCLLWVRFFSDEITT